MTSLHKGGWMKALGGLKRLDLERCPATREVSSSRTPLDSCGLSAQLMGDLPLISQTQKMS
jgi:hypothetical protein